MGAKLTVVDETNTRSADRQTGDLAAMARHLWQMIGAVKLGNRIAINLSTQTIRALEQVRDNKLYLAEEGYPTFDSFLDNHPDSPISYDAFRRRVNLLESEGDAVFDLLNSLNVPMTARKLLAGQVAINGNEIEIGDTKVPLDDRAAIVNLISTLHAKDVEQARTIERGKKENDKHKRRIDKLQDQVSRGGSVAGDATPHVRALVSVIGGYQLLAQEVSAIEDEDELKRFRSVALERLAEQQQQLETALGFNQPKNKTGLSKEALQDLLEAEGD